MSDFGKLPSEHTFGTAIRMYFQRFKVLLEFIGIGYLFLALVLLASIIPSPWRPIVILATVVVFVFMAASLVAELLGSVNFGNLTKDNDAARLVDKIARPWVIASPPSWSNQENTPPTDEEPTPKTEQTTTRFCHSCGRLNTIGSVFCPSCGARLE